jgi:hypothetical protein
MSINLDDPVSPDEKRRAAVRGERSEAIEGLRAQITTLEERDPELKQAIVEFEKNQRATISELEKTERTTISELEKTQRSAIVAIEQKLRTKPDNAEELEGELERKRDAFEAELERTRTRLKEELERTRKQLDEELAGMKTEYRAIRPALIEARCKLGMKMSDFALDEHEGHEQAVEYLQPLLVELRTTYSREIGDARRTADDAEEKLKELEADHHASPSETLPLVEERFEALIDAEGVGATIAQARARLARHRLELVDPEAEGSEITRVARERELEVARDELDEARAKVAALQEEKKAAVHHYSHPKAERGKALGKQLGKRFGRHH